MGQVGILGPEDRVELIEGEIVRMSAIGRGHAFTVMMLTNLLVKAVGDRALVSPGNPVRLTRHTEPQPDLMLLRPDVDYRHEPFVGPGHVLLVIEVAESSLTWDRGVKLRLYARAAIPEVWIVDVEHERVEVHRDPAGGVYRAVEVVPRGGRLGPAALPGVEIAAAAVL
ncbi:MAG: hypothetical protein A3F92_05775 [Candidatus Rokubacteria bacterium RIFCSPLOWO2_12_FULL_71_22]|nr:MAG: hypothetical protein A3F92_05775 [Candidatus Rokubacteria bacterium RIFCSPLOWO2_12_FULL_71_22]